MFPVLVTRSIESLPAGKLSVVFTARFADGTEKMLRDVRKNNGITKPCEIGTGNEAVLTRDECPLYFLNWANNPIFGSFKKDYPKKSPNFQVGDLVVNFGAVAVVDGFNNGDLILKIVACTKDGVRQGGVGQRFGAPAKNCRLVNSTDGVKLTHL